MDYLAGQNLDQGDTRFNRPGQQDRADRAQGFQDHELDIKGADLGQGLNGGRLSMANDDACRSASTASGARELGAWNDVKDHLAQAENVRADSCWWRAARRRSASSQHRRGRRAQCQDRRQLPEDSHPPIIYPAALTKDFEERRTPRPSSISCAAPRRARRFEKQGFTVW